MSDTPTGENEEQGAIEAEAEVEAAPVAAEEEAAPEAEPTAEESVAADAPQVESGGDEEEEEEEEVETTLYRVVVREDEQVIDGRIEAVEKAKEISIETGQSVLVERTDGRVKMNFRDGALIDYVLETRKGRRA